LPSLKKCENQKMSKYCGKRVYASKYLEIIHKDSLKFNTGSQKILPENNP
jgi:hypothetical protein